MNQLYENRLYLYVFFTLISVSFFFYYFLKQNKNDNFTYYWRGFIFVSFCSILALLGQLFFLIKPIDLVRKILIVFTGLYGFYLVVKGTKRELKYRNKIRE
jgi:uncharacterized membrane protein YfcA